MYSDVRISFCGSDKSAGAAHCFCGMFDCDKEEDVFVLGALSVVYTGNIARGCYDVAVD